MLCQANYGFPVSYASRKQNSVWSVIHWVDNSLRICGRCVSPSAYLCQPMVLVLPQDDCREFRDLFRQGKLSCTRENDPVRDSSGKQHSNKCIMCAEKLWVEEKLAFSVRLRKQLLERPCCWCHWMGSLAPPAASGRENSLLPGAPWYSLSHLASLTAKGKMSRSFLKTDKEKIRWD